MITSLNIYILIKKYPYKKLKEHFLNCFMNTKNIIKLFDKIQYIFDYLLIIETRMN